ncbi:CoA pyrophosphatase [Sandarakinorhabdus cyanobacteriorum]|uniref:CoA pyrophosphatase n=1 Tax=Sandarakinorhabdus cyanobacteriorum TaxID=1981098 RepID=A0A255YLE8_9SPHN|nr:CoA pyrophosphatase [Sandarakinorhabdus cyanobacteriorum]OYQ29405.1 CoA pyrophosphatase [Sandarakinorhabdus cyanobacteriorum]
MPLDRVRALLAQPLIPNPQGDWDLGRDPPPPADRLTPAAVLMAISNEADPQLLLTRRTAHLKRHAGQVAFPGGRQDEGDAGLIATALREAEEEVAMPADVVEVLGTLDPYRTGTGFIVTPVVGVVPPGLELRADPGEVDTLFHVPLAHVIDPANHVQESAMWQGRQRQYWTIRHDRFHIWGATAGMIVAFSQRLAAVR